MRTLLPLLLLVGCTPTDSNEGPRSRSTATEPTGSTAPSTTTGTPTVDPEDVDGDGFTTAMGDCDDRNPSIYPGGPEVVVEGDVLVDCQGELAALTCVQRITGLLDIREYVDSGDRCSRVTDLSPLRSLESVGGLSLSDTRVSALDDLAALSEVGDRGLYLSNNDLLIHVDALRGLTAIDGNLRVQGNDALEDLFGLRDLTVVGGNLVIAGNPSLDSLYGLSGVRTIGGGLEVSANGALTSRFLGLQVTSRLDFLRVVDNVRLRGLGLGSIPGVDGSVTLRGNGALTSLDGLPHLTTVGDLTIEANPVLRDLGGLAGLMQVDGDLVVVDNNALVDLGGLESLQSVTGDLVIAGNVSLVEIDALDALDAPVVDLTVGNNNALVDLAGLANLTGASGTVRIVGNPSLVTLGGGLDRLAGHPSSLEIRDNDALVAVDGLASLEGVGNLDIGRNDQLVRIDGLTNLARVDEHVQIHDLPALVELSGLGSLTAIGGGTYQTTITGSTGPTTLGWGGLYVSNNHALPNLDGLASLAVVAGDVSLASNGSLADLDGLGSLRRVGTLSIHDNGALTDITGLGIEHVAAFSMFTDNPLLCRSQIDAYFASLLSSGPGRWVAGNNPGC